MILFTWLAFTNAQDLRASFEQLNNKIKTAQELLRLFPDEQAKQLVESAISQRDQGLQEFRRGRNKESGARLQAAISLVDRAIEMLSRVPVERIREQVDDLLRQAEILVVTQNNARANRLLQQARNNRQAAQESERNQQMRKAMEHYRIAKFYAERSISIVNLTGNNLNRQTIEDEKNRYDELYNRAREQTSECDNPQAQKMVEQAEEQYQDIQQAIRNGNYKLALNLYYSNTRLLLRAIDLCRGMGYSLQEDAVEAVEMLGEMVQSATDGQNTNNQGAFVMSRVEKLYQQASQALDEGRFQIALRQAQLGRKVLERVWNTDEQPSLDSQVREELDRLNQEIDKTNDTGAANQALLKAAGNSAKEAERLLTAGRVRMALEMIYAGNRMVSLSQSGGSAESVTRDVLNARMEQLAGKIENARSLGHANSEFIEMASKMLENANQASDRNQARLSLEYIKIGEELIEKAKQE